MKTKEILKLDNGKHYQFDTDEDNSFIVVNKAVIHKQLIDQVTFIQEGSGGHLNNDGYKYVASQMAEIFAHISISAEYMGEYAKIIDLLKTLHWQLALLRDLSAPDALRVLNFE